VVLIVEIEIWKDQQEETLRSIDLGYQDGSQDSNREMDFEMNNS
jgi:hypothetical protein